METESDSSSEGRSERQPSRDTNEAGQGRRMLLEEARTTTNQQLAQINKNEVAAVRTVRITFVLLGLLAGGSHVLPLPGFGLLGVLGMWSLVGSLLAGLFVYGTTKLFIGARPDQLSVDYTEEPNSAESFVEVLGRYEDGVQRNQQLLYANGFGLGVSRLLLALAVVFVVLSLVSRSTSPLVLRPILVWQTNIY